jgi:hypothetical protein
MASTPGYQLVYADYQDDGCADEGRLFACLVCMNLSHVRWCPPLWRDTSISQCL